MAKQIGVSEAKRVAQREMGKPIKVCGFEHREIGNHIVNILYFSLVYTDIGTQYRVSVFVDGKSRAGVAL